MVYEIVKEIMVYDTIEDELAQIRKSTYGGASRFNGSSAIESANDDVEFLVAAIKSCAEVDKIIVSKRIWKEGRDLSYLNRTGELAIADITYCYDGYIFIWKIRIRRKKR